MYIGPYLAIRGAVIGCFLVIVLCGLAAGNLAPANAEPMGEASANLGMGDPGQLTTESECAVSKSFSQDILQWCDYITINAEEHALPPNLIAAVMLMESGGNALAYSRSGAVGLMQVMPRDGLAANFQCANGPCFASRPTIAELQDPDYNVAYGVGMLAGLAARYGNLREALRAYGPMDVGYDYADKVLAIYERYQ
ncbi:MAG: transglycosylase SLT domain-containing protein [Anaerolineales bacterium]|nr:transglycosylase SLT domain-containing protein [Anaerolineales bacterium]